LPVYRFCVAGKNFGENIVLLKVVAYENFRGDFFRFAGEIVGFGYTDIITCAAVAVGMIMAATVVIATVTVIVVVFATAVAIFENNTDPALVMMVRHDCKRHQNKRCDRHG
jgi:uncharacterized membrane protein (UPF0182 family)